MAIIDRNAGCETKTAKQSEMLLNRMDNLLGNYYDLLNRLGNLVHFIVPGSDKILKSNDSPPTPKRDLFIDALSTRLESFDNSNKRLVEYVNDLETF